MAVIIPNSNIFRQTMLMSIVCLAMLLPSCSSHTSRSEEDSAPTTELDSIRSLHDISADARRWADSVTADMTMEQLAGQLLMPAVYADDSPATLHLLRQYASDFHVGGVVLLKGNPRSAHLIADTLRRMLAIAPLIAIDAEWGLAMRLADTPEFPRNGRISPAAEETGMFDYGMEVARECREIGINMVLGPVLDVLPQGRRSSGIGSRSFGRDPLRAATLGVAYAKGLEAGGVISVAKHFPGHGSADADSHRRLPVVAKTRQQLEDTDLLPFRDYISNGLSGIMTGHLSVPALDSLGVPVTVSDKILKEFLREELDFNGLILTDAINMAGANGYSAADAIAAGADIVLAPADTGEALASILTALTTGSLSATQIRERARRVLFYKFMLAGRGVGEGYTGDRDEAERIIKLLR